MTNELKKQVVAKRGKYIVPTVLELPGWGLGGSTPSSCLQTIIYAHFLVKIGFKFQPLCKISNTLTTDPPVLLGHSNTGSEESRLQ